MKFNIEGERGKERREPFQDLCLKLQLRREVRIENISSDEKVESLRQELKKKNSTEARIPYRHKYLRIEFEKRESGFSLFISRDKIIS